MALIAKLTHACPKGIFVEVAGFLFGQVGKRLSLGRWIVVSLAGDASATNQKLPAWLGDAYQSIWLLYVILTALLLPSLLAVHPWLLGIAAALLLYRLFELTMFLLSWVLVDAGPLHSYRRSVIAFALNAFEIAFIATGLDTWLQCTKGSAIASFWTHLGAIVALDGSAALHRTPMCAAIPVARFGVSVLLMVLIVATLAGGLIRAEVGLKPATSKPAA